MTAIVNKELALKSLIKDSQTAHYELKNKVSLLADQLQLLELTTHARSFKSATFAVTGKLFDEHKLLAAEATMWKGHIMELQSELNKVV